MIKERRQTVAATAVLLGVLAFVAIVTSHGIAEHDPVLISLGLTPAVAVSAAAVTLR